MDKKYYVDVMSLSSTLSYLASKGINTTTDVLTEIQKGDHKDFSVTDVNWWVRVYRSSFSTYDITIHREQV